MAGDAVVRRRRWIGTLLLAVLSVVVNGQATVYYFSGAVQVSGSGSTSGTGSPAVQAQCPSDHPDGCSSIGAANWCCPNNNVCSWSNAQVLCCPLGQACSSNSGGGAGTWQQPQTTTVYVGGGGYAPAGYTTPIYATTTQEYNNGEYCSTLVEVGPNLPTTARGECGTILIAAPGAAVREVMGVVKLFGIVIGLQIVGALAFTRR
ncbi:hypothetical protein EJ03DRAFT_330604 [Teratosphaeria nubilosa]|uniref:Uncharacterized protein n=1 Tax=Teratosphaeria nubilosa TaxID=161662 RepID=A0A6G1L0A4_9PEZI|nr:hypothetical protein EJ03DRAFT_330604 [Teratosphaeria nubilosa]